MMLTLPLLIALWTKAAIIGIGAIVLAIRRPQWRWRSLLGGYLGIGFFFLALPMKIGMPALSWFSVVFLTLIWPVWLGQGWFDYHVLEWLPVGIQNLLFTFE